MSSNHIVLFSCAFPALPTAFEVLEHFILTFSYSYVLLILCSKRALRLQGPLWNTCLQKGRNRRSVGTLQERNCKTEDSKIQENFLGRCLDGNRKFIGIGIV
jgi:hypothetical protein